MNSMVMGIRPFVSANIVAILGAGNVSQIKFREEEEELAEGETQEDLGPQG